MKIIVLCMAVIVSMLFAGCTRSNQNTSSINQSDAERVEVLINSSLVEGSELQRYIEAKNDEAFALEMILDYNNENDTEIFSENNGKPISDVELKKRMLILSHNLSN